MARHTRRLILWITGSVLALAVLALLAVAVLLFTIDPDVFRPRIEAAATRALGRQVRLSGGLRWRLGWQVYVESRGGQIANAPGFGAEPFARWQALRLGVAVRPLLQRQLRVDRIVVDGLELNLQRD